MARGDVAREGFAKDVGEAEVGAGGNVAGQRRWPLDAELLVEARVREAAVKQAQIGIRRIGSESPYGGFVIVLQREVGTAIKGGGADVSVSSRETASNRLLEKRRGNFM